MICSLCLEDGHEVTMKVEDYTVDFHDPADAHGHGQLEGKVLVCPRCGNEEEYDRSPSDMDDDS